MSQPDALPEAIVCLFRTGRACLLSCFPGAMEGDPEQASAAIFQMVSAYNFATAPERDRVGRIITFGAAAMDSLRLSGRPGLSEIDPSRHRAVAIALNRTAEQCRRILQAMQANRDRATTQAAGSNLMAGAAPMPSAPPPTSVPPRPTPPPQPHPPQPHPP